MIGGQARSSPVLIVATRGGIVVIGPFRSRDHALDFVTEARTDVWLYWSVEWMDDPTAFIYHQRIAHGKDPITNRRHS